MRYALLIALIACGVLVGHAASAQDGSLPDVLILGIDTLRGDHLGCGGNEWIATPHMDALAADGVLFTKCFSTAPWTLPSFASIFTGLTPYRHGAIGGGYSKLSDDHITLTEYFATAGYRTAGYVSIDYLTPPFGMGQGFNAQTPPGLDPELDRASRITWLGLETLARRGPEPLFLFLHYFDVHAPYDPPEPFTRRYYEGDEKAPGEPITTMLRSETNRARNRDSGLYDWLEGVTDLDFPVKEYAAGVTYVDDHVGQLVADLKQRGRYDRTLIVLVSDHGEHLGEHDIWFTHTEPYQEALHVPLIIKFPGNRFAGTTVDRPVSTMDLMPTLLEPMRARMGDIDGRSLLPLCAGGEGSVGSLLVAEQGAAPDDFAKSYIDWPWKIIAVRKGDETRYELYNLNQDPGETQDLSAEMEAKTRRMRLRLWRIFDPESPLVEKGVGLAAEVDEATRKRLEALGY